ncbi:MAG: MAE_28990/MAE_18760 family HEPN-like nuclease [Pseudomonadota bacterium]
MTTLRDDLDTRKEEFDTHFALAEALEDRMMIDASIGTVSLSARHINTIKSGLIVHLYNIEEAIMSQALHFLGGALGSVDPRKWTEHSLREWLRESIVARTSEGSEDGRLSTVYQTSNLLLTQPILGQQKLKKPSGTWDDKVIAKFVERMNVTFNMPPDMWRDIAARPEYGEKTPLQFLADRRNAIAHGRRSFEDGASDLGLNDIRKLADITLGYMKYAADAFQAHIDNDAYLVPAA